MANVQISDLPFATLPLVGATTFFEVEATEGGVVVSRRVAADDLVISATTLFIDGTSTDDPSIGGGVFDGQLLWRNANAQQTGVFGFDPAGDNFIWSNDAQGGFHQIAIRDGTVLVETIAAAAGGLLVNNLLTGAGLERVLTVADISVTPSLGGLTDVTLTAPATGAVLYKSAGDWLDTPGILIDPAADVKLHQATVEVFRTLGAAAGGAEANNTLTGAGFERVLTASDAFTGIIEGSSVDSPETPGGTWDGVLRFDNANSLQTARVGFDPAGDTFFVQPTVEGGRLILGGRSPGAPGPLREALVFDFDTGGLPAGSTRFFETNGTAEQMRLDTGVSAVTNVANVGNNPASGLAQHGQFRITNNVAQQSGEFGFPASGGLSTTMQMKNFVHGGPVQLVGENAAGTERVLFFYDPDNSGPIIFGPLDNNPATDASIQDTRLTFRNPSAQTIWQIGFLEGTNDFSLKLFQDTGTLRLRGSSAASADVLLAIFDPIADAKLFQAGAEVFRTITAAAGGAQANNTLTGAGFERVLTIGDLGGAAASGTSPFDIVSGAAVDVVLTLTENVTLSTTLQHTVATDITILRNEVNSGHVQIRGRSSAGGDALMASFDPDNQTQLYWDENLRVRTAQFGTELIGSSAAGSTIRFFASNGTTLVGLMTIGGGSINEIQMLANATNNGQGFRLLIPDTGGTQRLIWSGDPDGAMGNYFAGVETLRTLAAASGGAQANNTLTGAGFERVLTIADRTSAAVYTPTNVVTTRTYDANATSIDELADVLGTLIADLQAINVIQ